MGTKRARRRLWLSHHGTPSTAQETIIKASTGPCLPLASGVPSSRAGAHRPPYGNLSSHSQFYVFFYLPASQGWAWAFLHPATEAGLPPQPDPELTTSLRRGPCQGDRPQEHSPETRAEWVLVGLWSGQMGERGASHPPPPPPGPSDGSNTAGPGPCQLREASGQG